MLWRCPRPHRPDSRGTSTGTCWAPGKGWSPPSIEDEYLPFGGKLKIQGKAYQCFLNSQEMIDIKLSNQFSGNDRYQMIKRLIFHFVLSFYRGILWGIDMDLRSRLGSPDSALPPAAAGHPPASHLAPSQVGWRSPALGKICVAEVFVEYLVILFLMNLIDIMQLNYCTHRSTQFIHLYICFFESMCIDICRYMLAVMLKY